MIWVLVFGGIALLGLVVIVSYGVWLFHKGSDLLSEVRMLGKRGEELAALIGQLQLPGETQPGGPR